MNKKIREAVYDKYDGHCAYCGKKIELRDMQVDHIVPLRRGDSEAILAKYGLERGSNDMSNLNPACRACNFRKGLLTVEQFREEIVNQCKHIIERSFQVRQSLDYGLLEYHPHDIIFYFEKQKKLASS